MLYGKVKAIYKGKGFGFISKEMRPDCYFHVSSLKTEVNVNDVVSFTVIPSEKKIGGWVAIEINKVNTSKIISDDLNDQERQKINSLFSLNEKSKFLISLLDKMDIIDADENYEKIKVFIKRFEFKEHFSDYHSHDYYQVAKKFFDLCTDPYKIKFYFDSILSKESWPMPYDYIMANIDEYLNPNKVVIFNAFDKPVLINIINSFINNIGSIENDEDYNKTNLLINCFKPQTYTGRGKYKLIAESNTLWEQNVRNNIIEKFFNICSDKYKILCYIDGIAPESFKINVEIINQYFDEFTQNKNYSFIIKTSADLAEINIYNYLRLIYGEKDENNIFNRLSSNIINSYWNSYLYKLSQIIQQDLAKRILSTKLISKEFFDSIDNFPSIDSIDKYKYIKELLNCYFDSVEKGLELFLSKQTILSRKEKLDKEIYQVVIKKIIELSSYEIRFQLVLDGYYESFDEDWIIENLKSFDDIVIRKIISFKKYSINQKIFKYLFDRLPNIATLDDFEKAKSILQLTINFDSENYLQYIEKILNLSNNEFKIRLWIERYVKEIDIRTILDFFPFANNELKEIIIKNCFYKEQELLFLHEINSIHTISTIEQYSKLKHSLAIFKDYAPIIYDSVEWLSNLEINQEYLMHLWFDGFKTTKQITDIIIIDHSRLLSNYEFKEFNENSSLFKILYIRLSNLGDISSERSFEEVKLILTFAKEKLSKSEYILLSQSTYENKSDYCKIKMYLYELVELNDERTKYDFNKIFRGQYFRLLKQEKILFLNKAKRQLPDFNKELLKNINTSKFIDYNSDGTKAYHTLYNDIYYNNGFFTIKLKDEPNVELYSKPKEWYFSRYAFNILQSYFSNKQQKKFLRIKLNAHNEIETTTELAEDLEELEKNILVIVLQKKSIIDEVKEVSKIIRDIEYETLSNKDLKRITGEENSECVHYLFDNISETMKPIYVNEAVLDENYSFTNNVGSWLFSIPLSNSEFAIIWESIKLDRATHIFKIQRSDYENSFSKIQNYLYNPSSRKRDKLNSTEEEDRKLQYSLSYWCRINHDWVNQCEGWYSRIQTIIPCLKEKK